MQECPPQFLALKLGVDFSCCRELAALFILCHTQTNLHLPKHACSNVCGGLGPCVFPATAVVCVALAQFLWIIKPEIRNCRHTHIRSRNFYAMFILLKRENLAVHCRERGERGWRSRHEVDFLISITFKWHIICLRHNIYVGCVAIERYIPGAVSCRNLCSLRWRLSERARAVSDKGQRRQGRGGQTSDSHL